MDIILSDTSTDNSLNDICMNFVCFFLIAQFHEMQLFTFEYIDI